MKKVSMKLTNGVSIPWEKMNDWQRRSNQYTCLLKYDGRQMTVPFFTGLGWEDDPSVKEVLGALISDHWSYTNARDFTDFCNELGYDPESMDAKKIYKACERNSQKLQRFLGDDLEDMAEELNKDGYC